MPRPATTILLGSSLLAGAFVLHHRKIHEVPTPPKAFQALIDRRAQSWGICTRRLDRPIIPPGLVTSTTLTNKETNPIVASPALTTVLRALFSSRPYALELLLSSAPESPQIYSPTLKSQIGHLHLTSLPSTDEAIFAYVHPGFDYKMYVGVQDGRQLVVGFVDYTDSWVQALGARAFEMILCEATARSIEKGEWDRSIVANPS
ncbi:hypothetical protein DFS34DRAFT_171047 [Phlyctochytrium arcticum]|nr:hypothetical protein DFS34DRAFT_171047 [Phlyctochytrium arcticum]